MASDQNRDTAPQHDTAPRAAVVVTRIVFLPGAQRAAAASVLAWAVHHLAPFALRTAFASPLVRRDSHDYYGACVTIGLAPFSPGFGRSTLKWPHCSLLIWPHRE
jgi:hypothetical protein